MENTIVNTIALQPFKDILDSITIKPLKENPDDFLEILADECSKYSKINDETNCNTMEPSLSEKTNINPKKRKIESDTNNTNKKIKIVVRNHNNMVNITDVINQTRINDFISGDFSTINFLTHDFDCKNLSKDMTEVVKSVSKIVKNKINFGSTYFNNIIHLGKKILECVMKSLYSNNYEEYNKHVLSIFDTIKYNDNIKKKIAILLGCPYELKKSNFLITDTRSFIIISHITKCDMSTLEKYARVIMLWFLNIKNLNILRNILFDYILDEIKTSMVNKNIGPLINIIENNINNIDMLCKCLNTGDKMKSLIC